MSNQKLTANPDLTIEFLTAQVANLSKENAILKALVQELNEQGKKTSNK
ncbi:hypothetical protein NQ016_04155 [Staphylococcus hyicus]|nr:hypothetical protein [Staphylococcus hyicus]MCQ9290712.1 hypothetical protein [Staphylococcus hyicus]MCQ9305954.1 hypothetical protein [Staphylococcus hyicus]MCQ9308366.1 hypothetical protein [Staphylococcus hyicus]MCQ9310788.1 hypothetical protein [Staphylococcus hyicus]